MRICPVTDMLAGGFVLFNPILGRTNIPAAFRTGMAMVLSVNTLIWGMTFISTPMPTWAMRK